MNETTTTTKTFPAGAVKVAKSSAECAAYNAANKEAIEAGLMTAQQPDDRTLAQEQKEAAEKAAGVRRFASQLGILQAIWTALPPEVQACYTEPKDKDAVATRWSGVAIKSTGYFDDVELEAYNRSSGLYSSRFAYYRVVVGSYGDKSIIKLNPELTITPAQLAKVVAVVMEKYAVRLRRNRSEWEKRQADNRREQWLKDPHNNQLAQDVLGTTYIGSSDKVAVGVDGRVTFGYETFTVDQWREVALLQIKFRADLKALKESYFKPVDGGKAVAS